MIRIEPSAWDTMVSHAKATYPNECCGAMLGVNDGDSKIVREAVPLTNAFEGSQRERYELRPQDLIWADKQAGERKMELIGIFHSHPDCDAYFSKTDLENSCPWLSFVVLSIQKGNFHHANSFLPNLDQTAADNEELEYPK